MTVMRSWVAIRGGPRAVVRVVGSVGARAGIRTITGNGFPTGIMRVLIVPVGDRNIAATVAVSEDHLGGKGVGAILV